MNSQAQDFCRLLARILARAAEKQVDDWPHNASTLRSVLNHDSMTERKRPVLTNAEK